MQAAEVLAHLTGSGFHVSATGNTVHVGPRAAITDDVRALVRAHKPALLSLLTRRPVPVAPLPAEDRAAILEAIEERAALREFDGGEPRAVAERVARATMRVYRVRVAMGAGEPDRWVTELAPGCDLEEATESARGRFGPARVLEVKKYQEQGLTHV